MQLPQPVDSVARTMESALHLENPAYLLSCPEASLTTTACETDIGMYQKQSYTVEMRLLVADWFSPIWPEEHCHANIRADRARRARPTATDVPRTRFTTLGGKRAVAKEDDSSKEPSNVKSM